MTTEIYSLVPVYALLIYVCNSIVVTGIKLHAQLAVKLQN